MLFIIVYLTTLSANCSSVGFLEQQCFVFVVWILVNLDGNLTIPMLFPTLCVFLFDDCMVVILLESIRYSLVRDSAHESSCLYHQFH